MRFLILFLSCSLWAGGVLDRQIPIGNNNANRLFEEKNYEEALKAYLDLYGQDTGNGALAYNIANTYAAMEEMEKAREFYQKALKSKHPEARDRAKFNMGNLEMASNQLQQAVRQYVDYLQTNPEDVDAKRNLEIALRKMEHQQQQQQSQDQDQDQERQDQQDQQSQDSSSDQQQQDRQEQQQQDQPQDGENKEEQQEQQNQRQNQEQEEQGGQTPPEEERQEEERQQPDQPKEGEMTQAMKEQILEALREQELQQQKEFQKRKTGRIKRRAKDW